MLIIVFMAVLSSGFLFIKLLDVLLRRDGSQGGKYNQSESNMHDFSYEEYLKSISDAVDNDRKKCADKLKKSQKEKVDLTDKT